MKTESHAVNAATMTNLKYKSLLLLAAALIPGLARADDESITIRVATYNVEFGKSTTPEEVGEMLKPFELDIVGFNEAPDGDWTRRVGKVLGMEHSYVGKISSANHRNKYKTILSRTPLRDTEEYALEGRGWNPATAVRAATTIRGVDFAFYSLHICTSGKTNGHAFHLASEVLPKEKLERVIVVGDFNNKVDDEAMMSVREAGMNATWSDLDIDLTEQFTWDAFGAKGDAGVIDHILYNKPSGAKATGGGIIELEKPLSDHKPVWAAIVFPKELPSEPKS